MKLLNLFLLLIIFVGCGNNYKNVNNDETPVEKNINVDNENKLNGYEFVDLGLSVNWATCNVGANSPGEYGDYFAWGETTIKNDYTNENYLTLNSIDVVERTKITPFDNLNRFLNLKIIRGNSKYDAATFNWGEGWCMPTKNQLQELIDSCAWEWTIQDGHNGYKVTGPSCKSIFLPAAGDKSELNIIQETYISCDYWSASQSEDDVEFAYSLCAIRDYYPGLDEVDVSIGRCVRPVCDK